MQISKIFRVRANYNLGEYFGMFIMAFNIYSQNECRKETVYRAESQIPV